MLDNLCLLLIYKINHQQSFSLVHEYGVCLLIMRLNKSDNLPWEISSETLSIFKENEMLISFQK